MKIINRNMKFNYRAALILVATMSISVFSFAQADSTVKEVEIEIEQDEDVVIDNKLFKIKFFDHDMHLDSATRAELETALKDAEISLEEAEVELEKLERRIEIRIEDGMEDSIERHIERTIVMHKKDDEEKEVKLVETSTFVMDLGLNAFVNGSTVEMPEGYEGMNLDKIRSINFHLGVFQQGLNLYKGHLRFVYGLGIEYNNY